MQVIAHRGASAYAPENTFAAFDLALDLGAPAFETDIQVTQDGVLVLLHDSKVDRTTNGSGFVSTMCYQEIAALDAGSWFSAQYAGEQIPRLDNFLDRYGKRVHYALEVKNGDVATALVLEVLSRNLLSHVTFTSFSFEACCTILALEPTATVGLLFNHTNVPLLRALSAAGLRQACPKAQCLEPDDVLAIRKEGLSIRTWGVQNVSLMHKVVRLGVDGTTVDFPDKLLALLK